MANCSLWSHGDSWFGVHSFSSKMSRFALDPGNCWWYHTPASYKWATLFAGSQHRPCITGDEPNFVLSPERSLCLSSPQDNGPSLEHTGTFSGDPSYKLRISFCLAQLKTRGRRRPRTLVPQGFCFKHHLLPSQIGGRQGAENKTIFIISLFYFIQLFNTF